MHEIGLYHPRIHFPSDSWVKAATLYWTKMARIVPEGFTPQDSGVVRAVRDELDFVVDLRPLTEHDLDDASFEFRNFVLNNGIELTAHYGVDQAEHAATHLAADPRDITEAHSDVNVAPYVGILSTQKVSHDLGALLMDHRLAVTAGPTDSWYVMHPALARVYMSVLADDLARHNQLRPVTDNGDAYAVVTGWTQERMRHVLLPSRAMSPSNRALHDHVLRRIDQTPPAIGMLAIQAVVPKDLDQISIKKIIQLRKEFSPQFNAFREAADKAATEIGMQIQKIEDQIVLRAYLHQEVQDRFLVPLQQLRDDLRRMKMDTATATLTFKYEVPALAGLVATDLLTHEPLLAGSSAVAVGLLGLLRGMRSQTRVQQRQSPVSYLMLIEDKLGARTALQQVAHRMRRMIGT